MAIDDQLIPSEFASSIEDGYVDLPFEAGTADPAELVYDDLPGVEYDPEQNWRDAQQQAMSRLAGEFAPPSQEATNG